MTCMTGTEKHLQVQSCYNIIIELAIVVMQITKHANRASPERKHRDTASLIQHLAEWASANSKLADVVKLPFQQQQEKVSRVFTAIYPPGLFSPSLI